MLIELEKGFVKTAESPKVNIKNIDVINKKIPEGNSFCKRIKKPVFEIIKTLDAKTKKNIEDRDKTAEKNIKDFEEKSKGKIKYNF